MDNSFNCLKALEVPKEHLTVVRELGEGQFGKVFLGSLRNPKTGGQVTKVAIKMLTKDEHSAHDHFFLEAMTMRKFSHPHIIRLVGVVSQAKPISLIMELAQFGELRSFLQQNQMKLQLDHLLLYCYQIANALMYLADKQVVHRDIAARNCLVFDWELVKLADFGLSRLLQDHNYYRAKSKGKMPIKWMAPESIFYRRFTSASDVWMFAVCCWEVFMFGVKPYQGIKNQLIVEAIERGQKLPRPNTCPKNVYSLLFQCWSSSELERPSFADLNDRFKQHYHEISGKNVEDLNILKMNSPKNSSTDQQIAEQEFEMLKDRLEQSIQQSVEDSSWLWNQERALPYKLSQQNINSTISPSPRNTQSARIASGDDSSPFFMFPPPSQRQSKSSTSFESPFKKEIQSFAVEIFRLIFQIASSVESTSSQSNFAVQNIVFDINSKIRQIISSIKVKMSALTSQDSQTTMSLFGRILEKDVQEVMRGYRLGQHLGSYRELLVVCGNLVVDIKNIVQKVDEVGNTNAGADSRVVSQNSI